MADPLRLRLVEAMIAADHSVAELARAVRVPLTRVYHHVDLLVEAGLIEVVRRIRRRGAEERRFRAAARRYVLDGSLLDLTPGPDAATQSLLALSRSILGGALETLTDGIEHRRIEPGRPGRGLILQDRVLRLSSAGFEALAQDLPAWLDEFAKRHRTTGGTDYRLAAAAFPAGPPPKPTRSKTPTQPKKR